MQMLEKEKKPEIFTVKRLSPEKVLSLLEARDKKAKHAQPRSYNITNDSQRFEFLHKVLNKELTIKEVKFELHLLGCPNIWVEVHDS